MNKNAFGKQVKALFDACLGTAPELQREVIDASPYSDAVKQRVVGLLSHEREGDSHLTRSIVDTAKHGLGLSSVKAGELIEQYRLLHPIGEGGQGEVWLAQRDDGEFSHRVAIKFIKLSHNQKELQRFQTERELLASLQHANIAGLVGGGKHQDRLFMIMEWIDGIPLLEYLERDPLSLTRTLDLFVQICRAVNYAHSKGIIHRDIKPSNVLVTQDCVAKLLDFGITKTLDADLTQTRSAAMMTLAYSSPEQINGHSLTTATDIYALGLILYELLTSHRAQRQTTESAADYIRMISDVTPVRPSLAEPPGSSNFPQRKLQGDLDNLVMMAIRKEPSRRYKNVDALIADVQNYSRSRPLIASGDSLRYKAGKLLRRNPFASMLTAVVLAFLVGLPIIMYQASLKLQIESKKATEQAQIADATTDFITTLLRSATPLANKGEDLSMRDVMEQGEKELIVGSVKHPKVKAKLYHIFGGIQHSLENNAKAIEHFQKAADISEGIGDYESQLSALGQQSVMYFFDSEVKNGNIALAKADAVSKKVTDVVELSWHMLRKSTNAYTNGDYQAALDFAQSALDNMNAQNNDDPEILGRIYNELAIATSEFDMKKSLPFRDKAIEYAEIFHGNVHPVYLGRLGNKIYSLLKLDRFVEADRLLAQALELSERLTTRDHPNHAFLLAKVAESQYKQGEYAQAEKSRLEANQLFEKYSDKMSFNYAIGLNVLAEIYAAQENYPKAKLLYKEAILIRHALDKTNLIRIASIQEGLARVLVRTGEYQQALELIEQVIKVYAQDKTDNLYNHIIRAAALIGKGDDVVKCQLGIRQIADLGEELIERRDRNWRRMLTEIWIGELAMKCGYKKMAEKYLKAGLDKSRTVYKKDSVGQKMISEKVLVLL